MSEEKEKHASERNLDLDPWFWATVAIMIPFMAVASVTDWAKEWYDRTFIWGAVPDNRKKKRDDEKKDT